MLSCFLAQQASEKALKALLYSKGKRKIISHSTLALVKQCSKMEKSFEELTKCAKRLDSTYLPSRYPDSIPAEYYEEEDSKELINCAEKIIAKVKKQIRN